MNEQNKTSNVIETILKHPFAFAFAMHSILSTIQCLKNGKMVPFFNFTVNVNNPKSMIKPEEAK